MPVPQGSILIFAVGGKSGSTTVEGVFRRAFERGWEVTLNTTTFDHIGLLPDYARAYHKSVRRLLQDFRKAACGSFDDHRDMDAFPIVFLYRHALETYPQVVVVYANNLLCARRKPLIRESDIFGGSQAHDLLRLLPGGQHALQLVNCSQLWSHPHLKSRKDVKRIVTAVNAIPHDAQRYPISKKMNSLLPKGLSFDVLIFAEKMDALLNLFEGVANHTWETFQSERLRARLPRSTANH